MFQGFRSRFFFCLSTAIAILYSVTLAQGAIFQWETNSQGQKQQSATLCVDGAGITPGPNLVLSQKNLTKAYLNGVNLSNTLFTQATLTNASFDSAILFGTVFNNANISGASFHGTTSLGFTQPQLQSTASYQINDENSNLSGIDLSGNNLRDWDFNGQNLTTASFDSSNLGRTDLTNANLTKASFKSAVLFGATFDNANINGANFNPTLNTPNGSFKSGFMQAQLKSTKLSLFLKHTGFLESGFTQAQLKSTKSYQEKKQVTGINFGSNNLSGWDFHGQDLSSTIFSRTDLTGADFNNAKIHKAPEPSLDPSVFTGAANFSDTTSRGFTQAQLKSTASYKDKYLDGIRLCGNNLSGWDFQGQHVRDATFMQSNLAGADFTNSIVSGSNFSHVILAGTDFTNAVIQRLPAFLGSPGYDGADFSNTTARGFTQEQLQSTQSYKYKNLTGINLGSNDLNGWNFEGQDLVSASFASADLTKSNLSQTILTNASFAGADLTGAHFTNSVINCDGTFDSKRNDFVRTDFSKTIGLTKEQIQSTKSYQDKTLSFIDFRGNNLSGWDLHEQNITETSFASAILTNANLSGATLLASNFSGADLSGADFTNSNIIGGIDNQGNIYRTSFFFTPSFTQTQLQSTKSYHQDKNLFGIRLTLNNLTGWDFHAQNLSAADFAGANLTNTNFKDAIVVGANFSGTNFTQDQLKSTASYIINDKTNTNLAGIELRGNKLNHWDFSGRYLANADFSGSTLIKTDLSNATIIGANFNDTTSKGFTLAQLQSTDSYTINNKNDNLSGIHLAGNNLTSWNFQGKDLTNARFFDIRNAQQISKSNTNAFSFFITRNSKVYNPSVLNGANFTQANLTNTWFQAAMLIGANFTQANLTNASFFGTLNNSALIATLNNADFTQANLTNANFQSASLTGANFTQADLTNTYFQGATLTGADLTAVDTRPAQGINITGATTKNTILQDGKIKGLDLSGGQSLIVRNNKTPIKVENSMIMGTDGILQLLFDSDTWNSKISFAAGIPVSLGGKLQLTFADGVDVSGLEGDSFTLFDWTGVTPVGKFAPDPEWNFDNLYKNGTAIFEGPSAANSLLAGGSDTTALAAGDGLSGTGSDNLQTTGIVPVPEPAPLGLLMAGLLGFLAWKFHQHHSKSSVMPWA